MSLGAWYRSPDRGWGPLVVGGVLIAGVVITAWELGMVHLGVAPHQSEVRALFVLRAVVTSALLATWASYCVLQMRQRIEAENARARDERHHAAFQQERATQAEGLVAYARALAHEVRVPLHGMQLSAHALSRTAAMDPERSRRHIGQCASQITADVARLAALVEDYLAVARDPLPAAGSVRVDLVDVVRRVVASTHAGALGAGLSVEGVPDRACCAGDPLLIERLVRILVEHALRSSEGDPAVRLRLVRDGRRAHLSIADVGPHLRDPENVFRPFHPTDRAGAGLALAVAYDIVRRHAGEIQATNLEGDRGVRFDLRLPLETDP